MADTAVTTGNSTGDTGLFQCGSCKRQYKRLDHLARHVRSPGHEAQGLGPNKRPASQDAKDAPGRVTQACRACSSNHLRCTEDKPCRRCTTKGIECVWTQTTDSVITPPPSVSQTSDSFDMPTMQSSHVEDMTSAPQHIDRHEPSPRLPDMVGMHGKTMFLHPYLGVLDLYHGYIPTNNNTSRFADPSLHDATMADVAPGFFPDWSLLPGQWTPMGGQTFELAPSIDLDDIDLRFLDAYNLKVPFEFGSDSRNGSIETSPLENTSDPYHPAALGSEAFRNSHWRFRPNPHDHGGAEEHNLSLPPDSTDHGSPESRIHLEKRTTCASLSVAARDKILTMVVESCRPQNLSRAVAGFPSVELLDTLIQYSLASPVARFDNFLHAATFDPNKKSPELVAAMAAAGAVMTADPALTKLGYAIQECVRVAVPKHWERDNTLIRDLELVQAFFITLEIGLWSGHGRKVEIAESFLQPLLTMVRRGSKFRRSAYPKIILQPDEDPASVVQTWHSWVRQESFKRVALRMKQHDSDMSLALLVNPLVSYAETQLPLPSSERLWGATTAEQWKVEYLAQADTWPISVTDLLDDPDGLHVHRATIDVTFGSLTFLSCAWNLAWEYIQLGSLQKTQQHRWNTLVMASRHEELLKLLNHFRICMDMGSPCAHELVMRLEIIFLHLQVPFEDIQLFAGMDGPEQARIVYPTLVEWVRSESARRAAWHAGQVIRSARLLPKTGIQRATAIMVYHAALTLWIYGLLSDSRDLLDRNDGSVLSVRVPQAVCLDEADNLSVQRFTQFGRGYPCIRGIPGHHQSQMESSYGDVVYLCHPETVMEVTMGILRASHGGLPQPRLVDQLVQLMSGLQRASRKGMGG
ncbi:hypothetical protein jhhlp_000750 [Lomentospora prolificans]|uniref:C2H2-type domain-containing protein n=1 Tax=Lomentospora prolificans TaxID=41688 RepID=A0A2N3NJL6_9PEZI|nr:hypothetical protein jhhlp_000750 [Lomentospora prolificans]